MIVATKRGRYKIGINTSLILPEKIGEKIEKYFSPSGNFDKSLVKELSREICEVEIKKSLSGLSSFVMETNQNCTLHCSYCVYSGSYQFYRPHQEKTMSLQTMKKSVDFFYNHVLSPYQLNRRPRLLISYYGGEILISFNTVMKSMEYARRHRDRNRVRLMLSVSTNGTLLTPEKIKILVKNQVKVTISLDGPESEHDRFRVFKNGKGSFKEIIENVRYIKREYPEYFNNNVNFIATLHPFHNLRKLEDFFLSNDDLFNPENVRINDLKDDSLTNAEWLEARKTMYSRKKEQLQKTQWFYKKMFTEPIENAIAEKATKFLSTMKNFTRSCFPGGEKLLIDPVGNLHICEKINRYFPIGNLDRGFDIQKIKHIFQQWRKKILELQCWKCLNLYFCHFCYASAALDGTFAINKEYCRKQEEKLAERISDYLAIKEEEDEKINSNHHFNWPAFLDSL